MSRPASATGSTPESTVVNAVIKGRSTQKVKPLGANNVALFISNLRLLHLDLREDWPDITLRTFDTKDAQQNQKKRIACVEWALYRLFELWDPATARDVRNRQSHHMYMTQPTEGLSRNYSPSFPRWSLYSP